MDSSGRSLVACVALLALVGWAGTVAARRSYADAAYRDGLGFTEFPAEDVPGRLEAYDEAQRRAPETFIYLLRTGQIHLARAAAGGVDHLSVARERLDAAVRVHPLDARARLSHARLLLLEGDRQGAIAEATTALELGPRHPSVQLGAVRVGIDLWAQNGDPEALRFALDAEALRRSWTEIHGAGRQERVPRFVAKALAARRDPALGDLLMAAGTDEGRLRAAHAWCVVALPDAAAVFEGRLRRLGARDRGE